MKVTVRSILYISKILGSRSISVELDEPATLSTLLDTLANTYGEQFLDKVGNKDGYLQDTVAVLINGTSVMAKDDLQTRLVEDDDVLIMPIIRGG